MKIHKLWELTRFELIMAVLTLAGVLIAIFTGFILRQQLHEMRTDQRAWLSISVDNIQWPKDATVLDKVPVNARVTVNNIGKTAARDIAIEAVMDYEVNGQAPDFAYAGRVRTANTTGILFPNSPIDTFHLVFQEGKSNRLNDVGPRYLTPAEYRDLLKGDAYMTVYVEGTFADIFDTRHWVHFCMYFFPPHSPDFVVSSRKCTEYNDTDSE